MSDAVRLLLSRNRLLVEGAGAASLAAALKIKEQLAGRRVALILSGGNISIPQLKGVVAGV
jgi:threonine dehydratase